MVGIRVTVRSQKPRRERRGGHLEMAVGRRREVVLAPSPLVNPVRDSTHLNQPRRDGNLSILPGRLKEPNGPNLLLKRDWTPS